jgi:thiopeptide-type bacteriocin biosynthesis protein
VKKIQKTFIVGEEWLYYKIYCGVKTADTILLELIKPVTEELVSQKIIDQWFFIRYSDPEPHVRVRFHLIDMNTIGSVLLKIKNLLKPYITTKQIWNVQLATYQRELERYGANTIEKSELFFFYDSKIILSIITNSKDDETRFLNLFNWLETLVSLFNFKDKKLLSFLDNMQEQFKNEFEINKTIRKELSTKYRRLESLLLNENGFNSLTKINLKELVKGFLRLENEQKLNISLEDLLASFIHMSINRCFRSKQRLYEMMLYDFLFRKNKSKFVRYGSL